MLQFLASLVLEYRKALHSANLTFSHVWTLNNILLLHFMIFYSLAFPFCTTPPTSHTHPFQSLFILILQFLCAFWLIVSSCLSKDFLLRYFHIMSLLNSFAGTSHSLLKRFTLNSLAKWHFSFELGTEQIVWGVKDKNRSQSQSVTNLFSSPKTDTIHWILHQQSNGEQEERWEI